MSTFNKSLKWDLRFLSLAQTIAGFSKDPSTKVGAVVVRPDNTIASMGYNGFPRGFPDNQSSLDDRTTKLKFTVHAELNALLTAKEPLTGYTIYTYPFPPCCACALCVAQAGIKRVVSLEPTPDQKSRWEQSFRDAEEVFSKVGIILMVISEDTKFELQQTGEEGKFIVDWQY